ncbi:MAG: SDR family NAD(P)-dependent oxidoreductase [Candidatus Bathyarchaeia archaeon]
MDVNGKVAIVTGASMGIGYSAAKLLASKGAKLALVARSKDKLEAMAKELPNAVAVQADMSKPDEVIGMVKTVLTHFGRIDILVNNAGVGYDAPAEKMNVCNFQYLFDLDVLGPVVAMKEVIPIMRMLGGGAIVNISSGTVLKQLPDMGAYSAMKAALAQFSLTAREELKEDNITVSVVYPYITATDFKKNAIKDHSLQEREDNFEVQQAWAKTDTAEHVASLILDAIQSGKAEVFAFDWMTRVPPK